MTEYESVGVIQASVADAVGTDDETILVEHDDPSERLICQPKSSGDE